MNNIEENMNEAALQHFTLNGDINKASNVDFDDNDEADAETIHRTELKYKLINIITKTAQGDGDPESFNFFKAHIADFCDESIYIPESRDDMKAIINLCIMHMGNAISLNWIDTSKITDMSCLFWNTLYNGDISKWDTSNVTTMEAMFRDDKDFNQDISKWDTHNVKNMDRMFYGACSFNLPLNDWDISSLEQTSFMFYRASAFNLPLDKWDVSKIKNMSYMFFLARNYNLDLRNWKVLNLGINSTVFDTCGMSETNKPKALSVLKESAFNLKRDSKTSDIDFDNDEASARDIRRSALKYRLQNLALKIGASGITSEELEFFKKHCSEFDDDPFYELKTDENTPAHNDVIHKYIELAGSDCDLNWIDTSRVKNMCGLFVATGFMGDISKWDVSNVTNMSYMFYETNFNGDISKWDVSNVKNMSWMFGYSSFNQDISCWDVSNAESMLNMFYGDREINKDFSKWEIKTDKCTDMFGECPSMKEKFKPKALLNLLESAFNLRKDTRTSNVDFDDDEVHAEDIQHLEARYRLQSLVPKMIDETISEDEIEYFKEHYLEFDDEPFYKAKTAKFKDLIWQFVGYLGNGCSLNWIDTSEVTDMSKVFEFSKFIGDISKWDVSNVTSMNDMFSYDHDFNGDISKWDVSKVQDMSAMFDTTDFNNDLSAWDVSNVEDTHCMFRCSHFTGDISKWNMHKVKDTRSMFQDSQFNGDISSWDVSNVKTMQSMFWNSKFNGDISGWDVSNVTDMSSMFYNSVFTGDISRWDVSNVEKMSLMFARSIFNGDISKWDTSNVTDMNEMFARSSFNSDISKWDVKNVVDIEDMFAQSLFNQDISSWDLMSVKNYKNVFYKCPIQNEFKPRSLKYAYLKESTYFNLRRDSKVNYDEFDNDEVSTDLINHILLKYRLKKIVDKIIKRNDYDDNGFYKNIDEDEIADKDFFEKHYLEFEDDPFYTVHSSTELAELALKMSLIFGLRMSLNWIDVSHLTDLNSVFKYSDFNGDISKWDVSNVRETKWLFAISAFNGDISKWDVSSIVDMHAMFDCSQFQGDISKWDVSNVRDMSAMFCESSFNGDISNWDVSSVESMANMFAYSEFNQDISKWDVSHVKDHTNFINLDTKIEPSKLPTFNINEAVSNFNLRKDSRLNNDEFDNDDVSADQIAETSLKYKLINIIEKILNKTADNDDFSFLEEHIEKVNEPFYKVRTNADLKALINDSAIQKIHDINWLDVRYVTDMSYMFANSKFNGDISKWDVSHVENMIGMFENCQFNGDINDWDVSNVKNMSWMFSSNSMFKKPIDKWKPVSLEHAAYMFINSTYDCDLSGWELKNPIPSMFIDSIIPLPHRPKNAIIMRESVSNFNLRRDSRVNDDEFDNDEVSADLIADTLMKYKIKKIVDKFLDNSFDSFEQQFFIEHYEEFKDDPFYVVNSKEDLVKLIKRTLKFIGPNCSLNWIDVHCLTDFSLLFIYTEFNGDISKWDVSRALDMHCMFEHTEFNGDISNWDVSHVTDMKQMFRQSKFNGDLSNWDVSSVRDMYMMFSYSEFNGDISKWDVRHVENMIGMFEYSKFNRDISNWSIEKGTNVYQMFNKSSLKIKNRPKFNLTEAVSNFNLRRNAKVNNDEFDDDEVSAEQIAHTSNRYQFVKIIDRLLEDVMTPLSEEDANFFKNHIDEFKGETIYTVMTTTDLSLLIGYVIDAVGPECDLNWIDVSQIIEMNKLFLNSDFNGDISKWDVSHVDNMQAMFSGSEFNGDISNWDVSKVWTMNNMFSYSKFNGDLSKWDMSRVEDIGAMFAGSEFNGDISGWDVSNVENMNGLFHGTKFIQDLSKWNAHKAFFNRVMAQCSEFPIEYLPKAFLPASMSEAVSNFNLRRDNKLNNDEFDNDEVSADLIADTLMKYRLRKIVDKILNESVDKDEIDFFKANFKQFEDDPFYRVRTNSELKALITLSIQHLGNECSLNWIDVSNVPDLSNCFRYSEFNGDISKWDVSGARNMENMFWGSNFNGDISNWDVSHVEDMSRMFINDDDFNGDLSEWDVSSVKDMTAMFGNTKFNGDISRWDVSNVENMYSMFYNSTFNRDISNWNVSNTTFVSSMFDYCSIEEKNKPKALLYLTEAVSNFNLRRDSKLNDDDFDSDEVSAEQIADTLTKYKLLQIVPKLLDGTISTEERKIFGEYPFETPIYTVKDKKELRQVVITAAYYFGNECNLNWIDVSNITDMSYLLCDAVFDNLKFNGDISNWDVHNVTNMSHMFDHSPFNGDISNWDVSHVKDMSDMFAYSEFNGDISAWDVSGVNCMRRMFFYSKFNGDISNWDVSKVKNMSSMFSLSDFNRDISNWNVSSVEDMHGMFENNCKFNTDISRWDVTSVTTMENMFAISYFNGDISSWDVSHVTNMSQMFASSKFNGDISEWDVSSVEDMCAMFEYSKFDGDISKWKITKKTKTHGMFYSCPIEEKNKPKALLNLSEAVSNFNLRRDAKVNNDEFDNDEFSTDYAYRNVVERVIELIINDELVDESEIKKFKLSILQNVTYKVELTSDLKKIILWCIKKISAGCNLNWLDVSEITDMKDLFAYDRSWFRGDISSWDVSKVQTMNNMFSYCKFNGDISSWDVSSVEDMHSMFDHSKFNGDISNWDVSKVKNMEYMFRNSKFTGDISNWNTESLTTTKSMFKSSSFVGDISRWDVSSVEDMSHMFAYSNFNGDITNWDTSSVTNMSSMFFDNKKFNQPIGCWNVRKVATFTEMFCLSNFNQDINDWEFDEVEFRNMASMFSNSSFNQPLDKWDMSKVHDINCMFEDSEFDQDISMWDTSNICMHNNVFSHCPLASQPKKKPKFKQKE